MMKSVLALVLASTLAFTVAPVAGAAHAETAPVTPTVSDLLSTLASASPITTGYDRALFNHWLDADGNGCDTRQEVLIAESVIPITSGSGCSITSGEWYSWYDGATWTNPSDVDIDHFVPLSEAWQSGANVWSADERAAFANDLTLEVALEAVTDNVNQSKSDRDPATWMPPLPGVACEYAKDWVLVKYRWDLAVDEAERSALQAQLAGPCGDSAASLPPKALSAASSEPVVRYGGADRYDAAVAISRQYPAGVPVVYVAKGTDYPDALVAAPAATMGGGPVLLTLPSRIPESVHTELVRLRPAKIVVVGGEASVEPAVFATLQTLAPEVVRLGGADRYSAARAVVDYAFDASGATRVYLTTGRNFPDALSAGAAAGSRGAAVLLVDGMAGAVDPATRAIIEQVRPHDVVIAGGPASVSLGIEASLSTLSLPGGYKRISGNDRFEAALGVAVETYSSASKVYLATGFNYPDALAGGALAGREAAPLFLVPGGCVTPSTATEIQRLNPGQIVILGGPNSVHAAVESLSICVSAPAVSISQPCGSDLSISVHNPNSLQIHFDYGIDYNLDGQVDVRQDGISVPANSTYSGLKGRLPEDSISDVKVFFQGAVIASVRIHVDCAAPPPPPPPPVVSPPANPGDSVNCGNFSTWRAAQDWFERYFPYYGDIARLDQDNDRIACESNPGAP